MAAGALRLIPPVEGLQAADVRKGRMSGMRQIQPDERSKRQVIWEQRTRASYGQGRISSKTNVVMVNSFIQFLLRKCRTLSSFFKVVNPLPLFFPKIISVWVMCQGTLGRGKGSK